MSRDDLGDKPKKSWRELDRQKDRSAHRRDPVPAMSGKKQVRADNASKLYKAQLDRFFEGDGAAPKQVKDKLGALEDVSEDGLARKAVAEFLARWELPPDHDLLAEVLACDDDDFVAKALAVIGGLLASNRPPHRITTLEQRLKRIVSLSETPSVQAEAKELIKKLRLFA